MCGIAGLAGDIETKAATGVVYRMMSSLARRGPDGEGLKSWPGAVLGHRRLAIFDLSDAGLQPMLSGDGRIGIVFNGSIYNYRELRQQLLDSGHRFHSDSDTEVLVEGYVEWGLDGLVARLRGMFAFGLWDDTRRTLFLVRDRLGVKPLCYLVHGNTIAFASTPRALRCAGLIQDLDPEAILTFIGLGYVPDQLSIYSSVQKVAAASIIEWQDGSLKHRRYWRVAEPVRSTRISFNEAVEETERLFVNAVQSRLYAHVPVGALLSGGVDSALVCWAIAKLGGNVTAYTLGIPGDPSDEAGAAQETAKILGLDHQVLEIPPEDQSEPEKLVRAYAEPFAAASGLGMLRVSEAAAGTATVLLTGDGGDDVFLGYPRHRHLWLAGKVPRWSRGPLRSNWQRFHGAVPRRGPLRRFGAFMDYASGDLDAYLDDLFWLRDPGLSPMLGDRLMRQRALPRRRSPMARNGEDPLTSLLHHEYDSRFVGEYLVKVDGATMYHALEARSPFLDQELWEFAGSLPYDIRLHGGKLKSLLRSIVLRRLGKNTARRRKAGFVVPVQQWIAQRWREQVISALQDSVLHREAWIDASHVLKMLSTPDVPGEYLDFVWRLYILELWMRNWNQKGGDNQVTDRI
jgi:asparagine synthase (glutamine-hydrolysing)